MKKFFVPLAILAMLGLLGAAAAWDCVRLAEDARRRVEMADGDLQKHEQRLARLLTGFPQVSPEVQSAVTAYEAAEGSQARRAAYQQLVASFRQTMASDVDPTNPLERRFMDDVAGAINRREIAEPSYDAEYAAYQEFLRSRRGSVARWFSATVRHDWKPGG